MISTDLKTTFLNTNIIAVKEMLFNIQNGQRVPPPPKKKLRNLGFKLGFFQNEVWAEVPKIPAKICILEEIRESTFQLSAKHSIFHLEFLSVHGRCCCSNSVHHITQDLGCRQEKKYISVVSLHELKKLGKYKYFFRNL